MPDRAHDMDPRVPSPAPKGPVLDDVFSSVYEELRRLASQVRRHELHATINSTALVHEAWLKLKDSPHLADTTVPHFKAIAARAMRQVLVEAARHRLARKRGAGEAFFVALDESAGSVASCDDELLGLDLALERLSSMNARQAKVVEARFFGGLNVTEAATSLGVSESVIERDWRVAKAWLASAIQGAAL
jgi:RNA polymerase sigma-70 factor, ECF subfamily